MIPLHHITLENGLDVVVAENHKAPVVTVAVAYRVGSKDERANKTGLAHLFEHVMFDNIPTDEKNTSFDLYLTRAGGESNAYTTYDYTFYHDSLPASHIELGLWLESERMSGFQASTTALETQINVVSEEILQTVKNTPYGTWRELQAKTAYSADCPYSWEVHGLREHVQSVQYDDATLWYNSFYRPDNACLVLSGDITKERAEELTRKYFAPIESKKHTSALGRNVLSNKQRQVGTITDTQDVPHNAIFLSYHFDGFMQERSLMADILASIMSDGRSSRLYKSLFYEQQIVAAVNCFADKREDTSLMTFYAFANSEETSCGLLADKLREQIALLVQNGIADDELQKAVNKLKTGVAFELQSSNGIADAVAQQTLFWKDPTRIHTLMQRYSMFSASDVRDFAEEILRDDNCIRTEIVAG